MSVAAPTPTSDPNAAARFISGKVSASPEMAIGPTPSPMKMLSTMLYSEEAVMAIMAGTEYWTSNLRIRSVPSSVAAPLMAVIKAMRC